MKKFLFAFLLFGGMAFLSNQAVAQTEVTVTVSANLSSFPSEMSWELVDDGTATVIASGACGTLSVETVDTLILTDGNNYTMNCYDDWGDGWNNGTFSIAKTADGCVLAGGMPNNGLSGDNTADCAASDLEQTNTFDPAGAIMGCTNPAASNYNPCATVDDGSCLLPTTNDACANAIEIPVGTCYTGTNIGATFGGDTVSPTCIDGDAAPADIWFWTTVPASGSLAFTLPVVPGFSSIIELYSGDCGALGAGILGGIAACSNYSAGGGITISGLTAGDTLMIRYWDFGSDDFGAVELCIDEPTSGCTDVCASNYDSTATIDDGSCIVTPDADECALATTLSAGTYFFTSSGATGSDISSCTTADSLDVWFAYNVPNGMDTLTIRTCGSSFDTGLSLWDGCGGAEIACNDDGGLGGSSTCGGSSFQSMIQLTDSALLAVSGTTVYIRVAGFNGQSGCGDLIIEESVPTCSAATPPQNVTHAENATSFNLMWDAVPLTVGCQIQAQRITPPGPAPTAIVPGLEVSSKTVPKTLLGPGTTWTWKVRCACQTTPTVIATAFSATDTLIVPLAREGVATIQASIYPNPADQVVNLSYTSDVSTSDVEFKVLSMLGQVQMVETMNVTEGLNNLQFDVSSLQQGTYFIQIGETELNETLQFTISR